MFKSRYNASPRREYTVLAKGDVINNTKVPSLEYKGEWVGSFHKNQDEHVQFIQNDHITLELEDMQAIMAIAQFIQTDGITDDFTVVTEGDVAVIKGKGYGITTRKL